jgi:hypothetical protein
MITLFGIKVSYETLAFFALFIASEYIGLNKRIRSNTVAQVIVKVARYLAPYRSEDDRIRRAVKGMKE